MLRMTRAAEGMPRAPERQPRRAVGAQTRRPGLAALAGVVAASAYYGGVGLITGYLTLGDVVTARLPFASPVLGGLALLAVVAVPATDVAWLAARGDHGTGGAAMLAGILLLGWIVVELAFIRQVSFFHPTFLVVGGLFIWLGIRARGRDQTARTRGRPSWRQLSRELVDVGHDLPAFLTAPLYRRRHLTWGATASEVAKPMPGDDLVPSAQYRATRAITIAAPPAAVWPWLVQVGCGRAGFYSNDLLDNRGQPSSTCIVEEFQRLEPGQLVKMTSSGTAETGTAFVVHSYAVREWLLWGKPDSTWSWTLTPLTSGGTRLVARIRARYDWAHPGAGLTAMVLMEFGDFAMLRRMLRGIKTRAESLAELTTGGEVAGA